MDTDLFQRRRRRGQGTSSKDPRVAAQPCRDALQPHHARIPQSPRRQCRCSGSRAPWAGDSPAAGNGRPASHRSSPRARPSVERPRQRETRLTNRPEGCRVHIRGATALRTIIAPSPRHHCPPTPGSTRVASSVVPPPADGHGTNAKRHPNHVTSGEAEHFVGRMGRPAGTTRSPGTCARVLVSRHAAAYGRWRCPDNPMPAVAGFSARPRVNRRSRSRSSARRWCRRAGCDAGPENTGYK